MKKLCLILLSAVFCFVSCYDDSALQDSVSELGQRVSSLEKRCQDMNTNITSMDALINEINEKDFVSKVEPIKEGNQEIGYELTFNKGKSIKIYNGKTGETPQIGVKKEGEIYYWTVNGVWLLNENDEKIQASATDGKDAVLPQLKIQDGKWMIKVEGQDWAELGQATGDSFFKDVIVGEHEVTITLADGNSFVLPLKEKLAIEFVIPAQPTEGQTVTVNYTITGAAGKTQVKTICQNGWAAKVTQKTYLSGEIAITAPTPLTYDEIIVLVADEEQHVIMSSISWVENDVMIASAEKVALTPEAGNFTLTVDTNTEYDVVIDKAWLTVAPEVKAMRTDVINFTYEKNASLSPRSATITLKKVGEGTELLSIVVNQEAGKYKLNFTKHVGRITGLEKEYALPLVCESITEWKAVSDQEWATVVMEGNKLSVKVTAFTGAERTANIAVSATEDGLSFNDSFELHQIGVSAVADVIDVEFADDGKATDVSAAKNPINSFPGKNIKVEKLEKYGINAAIFSHPYAGYPTVADGTYTIHEAPMRPKMENGFTMEALMMCAVKPMGGGKESKAFSSTATGGTALMISGYGKLQFLLCGIPNGQSKVWRFMETKIVPVPGQWYHVIGTWDKATGNVRVYVDGKKLIDVTGEIKDQEKHSVPANMDMHWSTLGEKAFFTIGANSSKGSAEAPGMNNAWNGGVAATRIYSEVLTEEQIAATQINLHKGGIQLYDVE